MFLKRDTHTSAALIISSNATVSFSFDGAAPTSGIVDSYEGANGQGNFSNNGGTFLGTPNGVVFDGLAGGSATYNNTTGVFTQTGSTSSGNPDWTVLNGTDLSGLLHTGANLENIGGMNFLGFGKQSLHLCNLDAL